MELEMHRGWAEVQSPGYFRQPSLDNIGFIMFGNLSRGVGGVQRTSPQLRLSLIRTRGKPATV